MSSTSLGGLVCRRWAAMSLAASLAVLILASCTITPSQRYETRCQETPKSSLHAVQENRLREIMRDMDRLAPDQWPQEMDFNVERGQYIREASKVVTVMAATAGNFPDVTGEERFSEQDRQAFVRLAERLHDQAAALDKPARAICRRWH